MFLRSFFKEEMINILNKIIWAFEIIEGILKTIRHWWNYGKKGLFSNN
jgi:hypothetical protein